MTTTTLTRDQQHDNPMRQHVIINGRDLYLDVPAQYGGSDSAPTPHDFVDAAVAACKAITIRMVAAKRGIPLQDVNITLESDASQEHQGRYTMDIRIELVGDLDEKQRQMLLHAAEQCPTGKLLTEADVSINASLVE
ncbi:MAG: peroxiredoxin [Gammaproteobacteria bacterium]|nr:MAG: peroxiredoxin [Gammaproteobacteria bacterium]